IGGSSRSGVAALDLASGAVTTWNPSAVGAVYSIAASGSRVYLGGEFSQVGGLPQSGIASIFPNITAVQETPPSAAECVLGPAAPNPFVSSTSIRLSLAKDEVVTLRVFDVHGREIAVLADGSYRAGTHVFGWDGKGRDGQASMSGVYFCELKTATAHLERKLVLVR
ncbi:MAG TPA: FlgD immunoglobulin-like domain containing protein, partial [Candidatus Eisenbacteria bacterium]|nr:FlgD immunoglobulin-like domain containing protein [Candidatus Eisenbacteria bacterium]